MELLETEAVEEEELRRAICLKASRSSESSSSALKSQSSVSIPTLALSSTFPSSSPSSSSSFASSGELWGVCFSNGFFIDDDDI